MLRRRSNAYGLCYYATNDITLTVIHFFYKLTNLAANLQSQLAARPPLTKVQALERDHQQLELLYHSTQRENQACMTELEKGKRRERILEGELARLVGDNWMVRTSKSSLAIPRVSEMDFHLYRNRLT